MVGMEEMMECWDMMEEVIENIGEGELGGKRKGMMKLGEGVLS